MIKNNTYALFLSRSVLFSLYMNIIQESNVIKTEAGF